MCIFAIADCVAKFWKALPFSMHVLCTSRVSKTAVYIHFRLRYFRLLRRPIWSITPGSHVVALCLYISFQFKTWNWFPFTLCRKAGKDRKEEIKPWFAWPQLMRVPSRVLFCSTASSYEGNWGKPPKQRLRCDERGENTTDTALSKRLTLLFWRREHEYLWSDGSSLVLIQWNEISSPTPRTQYKT